MFASRDPVGRRIAGDAGNFLGSVELRVLGEVIEVLLDTSNENVVVSAER